VETSYINSAQDATQFQLRVYENILLTKMKTSSSGFIIIPWEVVLQHYSYDEKVLIISGKLHK